MLKRTRYILSFAPTPMAGLALGIASLGCSWTYLSWVPSSVKYITALIGAMLLLLLLGKFVLQPSLLSKDLKHPVVGSVVPAFAMALMMITISLEDFMPKLGIGLWLIAIALHVLFLVTFIYHRCKSFTITDMVPSWFVPSVGIIVAAISCPSAFFQPFAVGVLWFGIVFYLMLLPVMIYRLAYCGTLPDQAKPTFVILAAPASICLAGYLTVIDDPSKSVVVVLLVTALIKTAVIYRFGLRLMSLPFSPGYAAFTFPLAVGATALFKVQEQCIIWGVSNVLVHSLGVLAVVELFIASLVVLYVVFRYVYYYAITLRRELAFA